MIQLNLTKGATRERSAQATLSDPSTLAVRNLSNHTGITIAVRGEAIARLLLLIFEAKGATFVCGI